jgi:hypothetical protein
MVVDSCRRMGQAYVVGEVAGTEWSAASTLALVCEQGWSRETRLRDAESWIDRSCLAAARSSWCYCTFRSVFHSDFCVGEVMTLQLRN